MAAYAALVSVKHIIDQLQFHPRPPISLDEKQAQSLTEKVSFLQVFLEDYSHCNSEEVAVLESQIADAAYAAEDVIESHIVDQILAVSPSHSSVDFYQGLQKVIEDLDSIKKVAMEIKEKMGVHQDQQHTSISAAGSLRSASVSASKRQNQSTMVGLDDVLYEMMDKLTGGQPHRQIIPVTGMGGIGKTTLARNIYENQVVIQYFDILAWVTVSQEYSMREILVQVLQEDGKNLSSMREDELGEKLYKKLSGWRYLIVMDDIWDAEVWNEIKYFFPDNYNGSRIMMTTRLSNLAVELTDFQGMEMKFLNEDSSWKLFCKNVFGKEDCPIELEEIGREIVNKCNGLPLSIVVIGAILAKSKCTRQFWENIAQNLNSIVNLEENEHCLQILYTSYNNLPAHLKPCFLYMGIFPEDRLIRASKLIKMWVAEGFLKPIGGKSLEKGAEEYLKELIDRNLILVHDYGSSGKIKRCRIHDLLRDLCIGEAQKQKFLCVIGEKIFNIPEDISTERRIRMSRKNYYHQVLPSLKSVSLVRSVTWDFKGGVEPVTFRLLRVSSQFFNDYFRGDSLEPCFRQVNLRYICVLRFPSSSLGIPPLLLGFPSSVSVLWNLQTLIVYTNGKVNAPSEIWKMPLLRHVDIRTLVLPDPPSTGLHTDDMVLEKLQTLSWIINFKCGEEMVKRIPNIKKLKICIQNEELPPNLYLDNLRRLHKLETIHYSCFLSLMPSSLVHNFTFPHSLKKLTLYATRLHWEDLTTKIGSFPLGYS